MAEAEAFESSVVLPASADEVFAYHARPGAFERLVPPWEHVQLERCDAGLQVGNRVVLKVRVAGVPVRFVAEHTRYEPPDRFEDVQRRGPFALWQHEHRFERAGEAATRMVDSLRYRLPAGALGQRLGAAAVRQRLEQAFAYRHRVTADDLALQSQAALEPGRRVGISGSTGLIGSQLRHLLGVLGHHPFRLVRGRTEDPEAVAAWEPGSDWERLSGCDAVVHLAGKPIAARRWTESVKRGIRDSRVQMTRQLCERLAALREPPPVLVCASAIGYYGDRHDEVLSEREPPGEGFLPEVSRDWEAACQAAVDAGIRVVNLRFGIVLSPQGGALAQLLPAGKLCLGGRAGSGQQWWSWVALDDVLGAIYHALAIPALSGPVNVTAPGSVRNGEFTEVLRRVLNRPLEVPAPAIALRMALGEMADALLLASARVRPERLQESGYRFRFVQLEPALRYLLGRMREDERQLA